MDCIGSDRAAESEHYLERSISAAVVLVVEDIEAVEVIEDTVVVEDMVAAHIVVHIVARIAVQCFVRY